MLLLAKTLPGDGLSREGLLLLTVTPLELLIIFIFQALPIRWLIITLLVTISVFASVHCHILP